MTTKQAPPRLDLDAHIRALVDAAPPLRPEQRARLAVLLAPVPAAPAGRAA